MSTAHFVGSLLAATAIGLTVIIVAAALFLAFCECTNWATALRKVNTVRHQSTPMAAGERRAA